VPPAKPVARTFVDLLALSKIGRPWQYPRRAILNAIFYVLRTGCQWRAMPHDLPHWKTA